jgi:hypothetical protein
MATALAQATIVLYNNGYTERDYYVVGTQICISRPASPLSERDVEATDVRNECLRILREKGVPIFYSWTEFERQNGKAFVEAFRARRM